MDYRTLGRSGCAVSTLRTGHDDLRQGDRRDRSPTPSSTGSSRPAARSSTPPTSTPPGPRGDHRPLAGGQARRDARAGRARHQGAFPDGRRAPTTSGLSRRHLATRARRLAAPARRRARRPLPGARLGPVTPLEETLGFLDDAVRAGKIHYAGPVQLHRLAAAAHRGRRRAPRAWPCRSPLQPQYNLLVREIEWEIVPAARGQRAGPAALVTARWRLADRQVPPRRAAHRCHQARRGPGAAASRPTTGAAPRSAPGT